jgi:hypothetical protein
MAVQAPAHLGAGGQNCELAVPAMQDAASTPTAEEASDQWFRQLRGCVAPMRALECQSRSQMCKAMTPLSRMHAGEEHTLTEAVLDPAEMIAGHSSIWVSSLNVMQLQH